MRLITTTLGLLLTSSFALSLAGCGSGDTTSGGTTGGTSDAVPTELTFTGIDFGDRPRFSPDSAKLAYALSSGDTTSLAVMDTAGGARATLAPGDNFLSGAAWTPDGKQIYFAAGAGIQVVAAAGGTASAAVMAFAAVDPDVSPDGKSLVYAINGSSLQLVDLANPTLPKELGASGTSPRFSPDGKSIVFESNEHIKTMDLASGTVTDVVDAGTYLASVDWLPDGKHLMFISKTGIERITLGASPERTLVRDEFAAKYLDVSPDGKTIAYGVNGSKNIFVLTGF